MKVNTDAVLLGAWCDVEHASWVLDIGTGCGVIALMIAQRSAAQIDAIDVDRNSIEEAAENFSASPWSHRIKPIHQRVQQFAALNDTKYDLIVCNPPFFQNSLISPVEVRAISKHDISLTQEELISGVITMLEDQGIFSLVLPPVEMMNFERLALVNGLYKRRQLLVTPKISKPVNRILTEFSLIRTINPQSDAITLRNTDNGFTKDYRSLTGDFYLAGSSD